MYPTKAKKDDITNIIDLKNESQPTETLSTLSEIMSVPIGYKSDESIDYESKNRKFSDPTTISLMNCHCSCHHDDEDEDEVRGVRYSIDTNKLDGKEAKVTLTATKMDDEMKKLERRNLLSPSSPSLISEKSYYADTTLPAKSNASVVNIKEESSDFLPKEGQKLVICENCGNYREASIVESNISKMNQTGESIFSQLNDVKNFSNKGEITKFFDIFENEGHDYLEMNDGDGEISKFFDLGNGKKLLPISNAIAVAKSHENLKMNDEIDLVSSKEGEISRFFNMGSESKLKQPLEMNDDEEMCFELSESNETIVPKPGKASFCTHACKIHCPKDESVKSSICSALIEPPPLLKRDSLIRRLSNYIRKKFSHEKLPLTKEPEPQVLMKEAKAVTIVEPQTSKRNSVLKTLKGIPAKCVTSLIDFEINKKKKDGKKLSDSSNSDMEEIELPIISTLGSSIQSSSSSPTPPEKRSSKRLSFLNRKSK